MISIVKYEKDRHPWGGDFPTELDTSIQKKKTKTKLPH